MSAAYKYQDREENPGGGATAAWVLGSTVIASGLTYFILREVFTRQVLTYCVGQIGNLQTGGPPGTMATMSPGSREARARQIRGMF